MYEYKKKQCWSGWGGNEHKDLAQYVPNTQFLFKGLRLEN
jgi:hypothetical protein